MGLGGVEPPTSRLSGVVGTPRSTMGAPKTRDFVLKAPINASRGRLSLSPFLSPNARPILSPRERPHAYRA